MRLTAKSDVLDKFALQIELLSYFKLGCCNACLKLCSWLLSNVVNLGSGGTVIGLLCLSVICMYLHIS